MNLSLEHLDLLLQVANDATLGATYAERMGGVSETLLALVPGSSLSMIVLGPRQPTGEVHAFLENHDLDGAFDYAANYVHADPLPRCLANRPGTPLRLSDALTREAWGKDAYTGEFLPRYQIQHMLGFVQPLPGGGLLQVAIHRDRGLTDFSRHELNLLGLASFDLGRAAFGALLREKLARAGGVADGEARVGILVLDGTGVVEQADAGARGLVQRLGAEFPMEHLLADVQAVSAAVVPVQHSLRVGELTLLVRVRPLEAGPRASVMAVLELRTPSPAAEFAARVARYRLSPREREVAELALRGWTNLQIGEELGISPVTAANHLTQVFAKVGVSGRVELTRRMLGGGEGSRA